MEKKTKTIIMIGVGVVVVSTIIIFRKPIAESVKKLIKK